MCIDAVGQRGAWCAGAAHCLTSPEGCGSGAAVETRLGKPILACLSRSAVTSRGEAPEGREVAELASKVAVVLDPAV